jgi:hypothetical protein
MLNLSDKDLDRLSQEAAQQHEPGDIFGPRHWEKLESRLDRDLGKVNPNPARGVRRLPYYYAPALLLILGITYYLVRLNNRSQKGTSSGSPPLTVVRQSPPETQKPFSSLQNPVPSNNSTSTPTAPPQTVPYPGTAGAANAPAGSASPDGGASSVHPSSDAAASSVHPNGNVAVTSNNSPTSTSSSSSFRQRHRQHKPIGLGANPPITGGNRARTAGSTTSTSDVQTSGSSRANTGSPATNYGSPAASGAASTRIPRDLTYSAVRGRIVLTRKPIVDDAALRGFDPKSIPEPIHKKALHINRSLVLGLVGGPDFSSVSGLAPDRPGSNIGITADYQLFNHFYIGSGLILSRKNFAATPQSYHVPHDYYRQNLMGMGGNNVDYIKGSFSMLEVPLNLRYDFTTSGSTLVFISAGASSYFFTQQNCGYYYTIYSTSNLVDQHISYSNNPDNLFATLDLSIGAEVGLTNSLSFLVAPYWKIPTRSLGFGQVQLTSVGLNFALRLAPVISRKRR